MDPHEIRHRSILTLFTATITITIKMVNMITSRICSISGKHVTVKSLTKFQKSVATIPKTWQDAYGDTVKATASEIATCLNAALDHLGAGNGLRSWRENRTAIKRKQKRQEN